MEKPRQLAFTGNSTGEKRLAQRENSRDMWSFIHVFRSVLCVRKLLESRELNVDIMRKSIISL